MKEAIAEAEAEAEAEGGDVVMSVTEFLDVGWRTVIAAKPLLTDSRPCAIHICLYYTMNPPQCIDFPPPLLIFCWTYSAPACAKGLVIDGVFCAVTEGMTPCARHDHHFARVWAMRCYVDQVGHL